MERREGGCIVGMDLGQKRLGTARDGAGSGNPTLTLPAWTHIFTSFCPLSASHGHESSS
jgi:hypothetical protein